MFPVSIDCRQDYSYSSVEWGMGHGALGIKKSKVKSQKSKGTYRTYALYKLIMVCIYENSSFQALINRSLMIGKPAL